MKAKATIPGTVKLNTSFINSESATAIALAGIILFALAFTVYAVIQVEYVPEWKTDAEYAHMNEVWGDMGEVKSNVDSLIILMGSDNSTAEAGISISVPLIMGGGELPVVGSLKSSGTLAVNEIPHTVEIKIMIDDPNDTISPYNPTYECGTVTFHSNNRYYVDQLFWYENGALIFEQDDHFLMKYQPSFINFNRNAENESDIYINPVEILGSPNSISGNIWGSLKLSANGYEPELNLPTHENFSINISTKYPLAWVNYLDLTARNAGLSLNENYTLSSTEESVNFTYLAGNRTLNIHLRNATIKAEIVVGGEGNTAWEYDEEFLVYPVADFTFNVSEGYAPLTVNFTDYSQNAINLSWNFGDGNTSTEENPLHTFVNLGTYTVSLTASNENGTDTETATITVLEIPVTYPLANFTANVTNGPVPLTVQFNDTSIGNPTFWLWDFGDLGDGNTSNISNPIHTYNTAGNYTVNLTVENINGTDSEVKSNYIYAGVLLIGDWYTYNNVSVNLNSTIDVEALQDCNTSSINESYFEPGGEGVEELEGYVPVDAAMEDTYRQENTTITFDFVNFSKLDNNVSNVSILIVYLYDIDQDSGAMPPILLTLYNSVFDLSLVVSPKIDDNVWYVFKTTVQVPEDAPENLTSNLILDINGAKEGTLLIDYMGVYLIGEG